MTFQELFERLEKMSREEREFVHVPENVTYSIYSVQGALEYCLEDEDTTDKQRERINELLSDEEWQKNTLQQAIEEFECDSQYEDIIVEKIQNMVEAEIEEDEE